MQRLFPTLIIAVAAVTTQAFGFEAAPPSPAAGWLAPVALKGTNYTVRPTSRSDGAMRLFDVDTPYGAFSFEGVDFTRMRLHEIEAAGAIEQMSQSDRFNQAFGRAALGPLKLGADLVTNPVDTVGRTLGGVGNMVDRFGAGLANASADRDSLPDSLLGVSDTQRALAVELGVDPYTDFPPLAQRLKQMAGVMAGGGLPVKVGVSFIPGGVGVAVSSASTVEGAADSLRDKTAAQVIAEVRATLDKIGVPADSVSRFVENRNYTPADLLLTARALAQLGAQNTNVFVDHAAAVTTRTAAFYERRHAQLLAARNDALGGVTSFITVAGQPINLTRNGAVVVAVTFDEMSWTDRQERSFSAATATIKQTHPSATPLLASPGTLTPLAASEVGKLGWKVVKLKPLGR
jgi:hypothetical protein